MIKSNTVNCPHCGFAFSDDELLSLDFNPWAYANNDDNFECVCPDDDCGKMIYVSASWKPVFECYEREDDRC